MIGVCGFVNSGSSAVCDLLKEYDDAIVLDNFELSIAIVPDGLETLEFHLMHNVSKYMSSNVAIERFRRMIDALYRYRIDKICGQGFARKATDAYLDKIVQLRWDGYGVMDKLLYPGKLRDYLLPKYHRFSRRTNSRFFKPDRRNPFERTMEFSIHPEGFLDASRDYMRQIIGGMAKGATEKKIIVDQPYAANDPAKSFHFFDEPKAIIVDRDPRDCYIKARDYQLYRGRKMPTLRVEDFIEYHSRLRADMPYKDPDARILRVQFEDMIFHYDAACARIAAFAGLHDHARPKSLFVPEMSAANVRLFEGRQDLLEDIQKIERALPEYLYDFNSAPHIEVQGKPFVGRSPLNRN